MDKVGLLYLLTTNPARIVRTVTKDRLFVYSGADMIIVAPSRSDTISPSKVTPRPLHEYFFSDIASLSTGFFTFYTFAKTYAGSTRLRTAAHAEQSAKRREFGE